MHITKTIFPTTQKYLLSMMELYLYSIYCMKSSKVKVKFVIIFLRCLVLPSDYYSGLENGFIYVIKIQKYMYLNKEIEVKKVLEYINKNVIFFCINRYLWYNLNGKCHILEFKIFEKPTVFVCYTMVKIPT